MTDVPLTQIDRTADKLLSTLAIEYPQHALTDHCAACLAAMTVVFPETSEAELSVRIAAAVIHREHMAHDARRVRIERAQVNQQVRELVAKSFELFPRRAADARLRTCLVTLSAAFPTFDRWELTRRLATAIIDREDAAGEGSS